MSVSEDTQAPLNLEIEEFLTGAAGAPGRVVSKRIYNFLMCSCGYVEETLEDTSDCNNCKTPMTNIGWVEKA